jgi:hypothetical protein
VNNCIWKIMVIQNYQFGFLKILVLKIGPFSKRSATYNCSVKSIHHFLELQCYDSPGRQSYIAFA